MFTITTSLAQSVIIAGFVQRITDEKAKSGSILYGMQVNGKTVLKNKYEAIKNVEMPYKSESEDVLVAVKQKGKWGFFNFKGKEVIPMKYEDCHFSFYSGVTGVKLNGKWGFIDHKGVEKIPFQYDDAKSFSPIGSDNYAGVKMNDKWGFINEKGKELIPFKYEDVLSFPRGKASTCVKIDGKWGAIDQKGKMFIDAEYDESFIFDAGGEARVKKDGRQFYINIIGREVEKSNYSSNANNNNSSNTNTPKKTTNYKCKRCNMSAVSNDDFQPKVNSKCIRYNAGNSHYWEKVR
jgi:hypothetical protein